MFTRTALPSTYTYQPKPREERAATLTIITRNQEQILFPVARPLNAPGVDNTGIWGIAGYPEYQPYARPFIRGASPALALPEPPPRQPPKRRGR